MKQIPNRYFIIGAFALIFVYLTIDFKKKGYREFPQLDFDWKNVSSVYNFGECDLLSVNHNVLTLRYKNDLKRINNDNTIRLETNKGEVFYFRFEYKIFDETSISFHGGKWLTQIPQNLAGKIVNLTEIRTPIIRNGILDVCFIGATMDKWGGFRSIRRRLKRSVRNINFVGVKNDVYGYAYVPFNLSSENKIESQFADLPNADIFLIFFETNFDMKSINQFSALISFVSRKSNCSVYLFYMPETMKVMGTNKFKAFNQNLNELDSIYPNIKVFRILQDFEEPIKDNFSFGKEFYDQYLFQISNSLKNEM